MIDKQTKDQAWRCLTAAMREEIREQYQTSASVKDERGEWIFRYFFGVHNLTSDAEPEEVLMVPRKKVQNMYAANERIKLDFPNSDTASTSDHINHVLDSIFGSKCLPDGAKELEHRLEQTSVQVEDSKAEQTQTNDNMEEKEHRNLSQDSANCDKSEEKELNSNFYENGWISFKEAMPPYSHNGILLVLWNNDFLMKKCDVAYMTYANGSDIYHGRYGIGFQLSHNDGSVKSNFYPLAEILDYKGKEEPRFLAWKIVPYPHSKPPKQSESV